MDNDINHSKKYLICSILSKNSCKDLKYIPLKSYVYIVLKGPLLMAEEGIILSEEPLC